MATFDMLGFKTPLEIFMDADISLFYELLQPEKVVAYVQDFSDAVSQVIADWGEEGHINVFDEIRTLAQRVGFRVWMGEEAYTIQPGVYITTMLSVINTQTPELARFDPDHYSGRRIDPGLVTQGKETVSTFGHGSHACPAQKFSHNMSKVLLAQLVENFEFGSLAEVVEPSSAQMGGVSRSENDVVLQYTRK